MRDLPYDGCYEKTRKSQHKCEWFQEMSNRPNVSNPKMIMKQIHVDLLFSTTSSFQKCCLVWPNYYPKELYIQITSKRVKFW